HQVLLFHYCLMSNHIHLLLRQDAENQGLVKTMHDAKMCYAIYYHKKYGGTGGVWEDRFRNFHIDSSSYLLECGRYIERNPLKAFLVSKPEKYLYSSYNFYAYGKPMELITINPEYLALSEKEEFRQSLYREYVGIARDYEAVVKTEKKFRKMNVLIRSRPITSN
ncbi:MAG: transposase, partial [Candidatus Omnitrophica bacterium]|nr:transposase [Candidatus Omnitrophota bacterium]